MSPLQIEILLHYYYSRQPHIYTGSDSAAEAFGYLVGNDMLRDRFSGMPCIAGELRYELTDKGRFYIEYILSLPLPVEKTVYSIETKD